MLSRLEISQSDFDELTAFIKETANPEDKSKIQKLRLIAKINIQSIFANDNKIDTFLGDCHLSAKYPKNGCVAIDKSGAKDTM